MGRILLVTGLFALLASFSYAQKEEETLFGKARVSGGFGGPFWVSSRGAGESGWGGGGGGGVVFGHFFLGGFGQGEVFGRRRIQGVEHELSLGLGGLWAGVAYPTHRLVHPYGSLKVGWGGLSLTPREPSNSSGFNDAVFAVIPEVGLELNVLKWFRLAGHAGYRWVSGIDGLGGQVRAGDFDNVIWGITLRFGSFGSSSTDDD
ncbi:MAG: hypothetical protein RMJ33_01830 [Saprospiraceae bacterium]|nr:hypothetical protein [Saprospiraceae bacterium]MDW8228552.1 hypothetical protein [Saprospiraceae bacterium]